MDDAERKVLFSGETQIMDWGQSRTSGSWIKLWVHDDDLEAFKLFQARSKGQAGTRLGTVMVEIGPDEAIVEHAAPPTPAEPPAPTPPPPRRTTYTPNIGALGMLAVRWCQDEDFRRWASQEGIGLVDSQDRA